MTPTRLRSPLAILLAAALAGGCAAAAAGFKAIGPGSIPAQFVPPKEPTLVLVENDQAAAGAEADCDRVGRYISQEWKEHDVAPLVDFSALTQLRDRDPDAYRKMSIAAIGRATGAKQVLYVSLSEYGADYVIGGDESQWKAQAKVKIVDATTGQCRWPQDLGDGLPLNVNTDPKASDIEGDYYAARDAMNKTLADKISKLFYSWDPEFDDPGAYEGD